MRHKTNLSRVVPCVRVNISQETGVTGVTGVSVVDDKLIVARSDGSLETITLPAGGSAVDIDVLLETIRAEIPAPVDTDALIEVVKAALPTPVDERGVVTGRLVGSNLELVGEGDEVLATVSLESLVPAAKADRFLSNVSYDQASKQLVFTTEAEGEDAQTITVPMADVIPVINTASTTQRGIVELATLSEAKTGTATNLAVTPAGLTAALAETKGAVESANQRIQALEAAPTPVGNDTYPTEVSFDEATRELVVKLNTGADLRMAWPVEQEEECTPITLEANQELRAEVGEQSTLCRLADGSVVLREPKQYVYTVDRQEATLTREDVYVTYDSGGRRVPIDLLYYGSEHMLFADFGGVPMELYPDDVRYYVRDDYPLLGGEELIPDESGDRVVGPFEYQDDENRLYTWHKVTAPKYATRITDKTYTDSA